MNEQWRPIVGFEQLYEVSSHGAVRKLSGRVLKQSPDSRGYLKVWLIKDGKGYCPKVHRMVAAAFLGPCPVGLEVNHKDGDKRSNAYVNLEYVTHRENVRHAFEGGMYKYGTERQDVVLNEDLVRKIRQEWRPRTRGYGVVVLSRKYGVGIGALKAALLRRTWAHVV